MITTNIIHIYTNYDYHKYYSYTNKFKHYTVLTSDWSGSVTGTNWIEPTIQTDDTDRMSVCTNIS